MLSRPQDFLAPGQASITWGPLFSAVKQVIRAGHIYDDHRSGIKQAIKAADNVPLALAGVTVSSGTTEPCCRCQHESSSASFLGQCALSSSVSAYWFELIPLQVLHTLGLNVPPKVRAQLAGAKWMERLEKVLAKPQDPMIGLAVNQVLTDWVFLYR
jgi:hypothetical protein